MADLPTIIDQKINQDSSMRLNHNAITVKYGDSYEQRAAIGILPFMDEWSLSIGPLTKSELDTFRTFWYQHGFADWWGWTAPEDDVKKGWVFSSMPSISNVANIYYVDVDVRQIRNQYI